MRALDHDPNGPVGQFEHLEYLRDHSDIVEVFGFRIVATRIELREQEDVLAGFHRRFERGDRFVAPDKQRHDHARKHDNVAQGKEREMLCHILSSKAAIWARRLPEYG